MAISEPYELDGVTVGATELSIVSGTTTLQSVTDDGIYQLWLDPVGAGLVKGDRYIVRIKEKVLAGSTQRTVFSHIITPINAAELIVYPTLFLLHGWDMTLQKLAGTDRAWDASVRKAAGAGITEYDTLSAVSVSTTELSLVSGTTTLQAVTDDGFYQFWLDPIAAALAKADQFTFRVKEKAEATGGVQRTVYKSSLDDAAAELFVSPTLCLINGWDATLQKDAGGDRSWDGSIRRAA